jgi:hypothetical protein
MFNLTLTNVIAAVMLLGIGQMDMCDQCDETRMGTAAVQVGTLAATEAPS